LLTDDNYHLLNSLSSVGFIVECRQKDLDGVGRHLLDLFKMNQDEDLDKQKTANKRRKEKRNSTKKELHEDGRCLPRLSMTKNGAD